ncbi:MAG: acyl-CoA thioesterase [Phycisphaeraceae bacterium]|nr:acyl-CoA thioesterase [Phycisphaeraceae bacterium]
MSTQEDFNIEVRVRYSECDPMNVAHHSAYPVWMEIARVEMLRQRGTAYRELEERGIFFVVARLSIRYRRPAKYDDILQVRVRRLPSAGVKVDHEYEIHRGRELIATAETTIVCVDRQGKLQPVPAGTLGTD